MRRKVRIISDRWIELSDEFDEVINRYPADHRLLQLIEHLAIFDSRLCSVLDLWKSQRNLEELIRQNDVYVCSDIAMDRIRKLIRKEDFHGSTEQRILLALLFRLWRLPSSSSRSATVAWSLHYFVASILIDSLVQSDFASPKGSWTKNLIDHSSQVITGFVQPKIARELAKLHGDPHELSSAIRHLIRNL